MAFSRMQRCLMATLCMLSPSLCAAQKLVNGANFICFQVGEGFDTFPMSVNNSLTVTGYYINQAGVTGGFIRNADGEVITFAVAGSALTAPVAINAAGEIAGNTIDTKGNSYGFVRYANGSIATFNPGGNNPGATEVAGINEKGTVVGDYELINTVVPQHGFIRTVDGVITTFDVPGSDRTEPVGINAAGQVAGIYWSHGNDFPGGFVRSADEDITTYPGVPVGINAAGYIAGWSFIPPYQGFVRFPGGSINSLVLPGTPDVGINEAGFIFGNYGFLGPVTGSSRLLHLQVYLRSPNGTMTSFGFPGSLKTVATSMNDSNVITGAYDQGRDSFGFLRIPEADKDEQGVLAKREK
jgi:hypothetical protein